MKIFRTMAITALAGLGIGCAQEPQGPLVMDGVNSVPMARGSSTFPDACMGMDASRGLNLGGGTLFDVELVLNDQDGSRILRAWAPANRGTSRSTRVERTPVSGRPTCTGETLTTEVLRAADGDILRWSLEAAAPGLTPFVTRGEFPVPVRVNGTQANFPIVADGRRIMATLTARRGATGILEDARTNRPEITHTYGRPLPDERPGRTLEDMRRAANMSSR